MGKINSEIKIDLNYAKTIQTVIDNVNSSRDIDSIFESILHYEKTVVKAPHNCDNINENMGFRLKSDNDKVNYICTFINTLMVELSQLK